MYGSVGSAELLSSWYQGRRGDGFGEDMSWVIRMPGKMESATVRRKHVTACGGERECAVPLLLRTARPDGRG
jgi:hypothetical protein